MATGDDYRDYNLGAMIKKDDIPAQETLEFIRENKGPRKSITDVVIEGLALWVEEAKGNLRRIKGAK